jgi:hypothetical protein
MTFFSNRRRSRRRSPPPSAAPFRPQLTRLEDRVVPSQTALQPASIIPVNGGLHANFAAPLGHSTAPASSTTLQATGTPVGTTEATAFTGQVASFTAPAPASPSDFTATIDWGDGSTTSGTIAANSAGGFSVTGSHTYSEDGRYPVKVTVQDRTGNQAVGQSTATVADHPDPYAGDFDVTATASPLSTTEGTAFSGVVATGSDPIGPGGTVDSAEVLTASIDWGDGTSSSGKVVFSGSPGAFTVSGSHAYVEDGTYTTRVTITEPGSGALTLTGQVTVADHPDPYFTDFDVTATASPISTTEATAFSGVVATGSDPVGPGGTVDMGETLTATINWGDGTSSAGTVAFSGSPGAFKVSGSHTYAEDGTYTTRVTITEPGSGALTVTGQATVADAPDNHPGDFDITARPVGTVDATQLNFVLASFVDPVGPGQGFDDPSEFAATIDWGDGTNTPGIITRSGGTYYVKGSHSYEEGFYTATVTITEPSNTGSAVVTLPITSVDNDNIAAPEPFDVAESEPFSGTVATLTDTDDAGDTDDGSDDSYSATIDWGDGSVGAGTIVDNGDGSFDIQGAHTYKEDGTYAVSVTIMDGEGGVFPVDYDVVVAEGPLGEADLDASSAPPISTKEGLTFTQPVAFFSDPLGPQGVPDSAGNFRATIDWGDGSTSRGTIIDLGDSNFRVDGTHNYLEDGTYTITVTITEITDQGTAVATTTANVAERPDGYPGDFDLRRPKGLNVGATEGIPFTAPVANFEDPISPGKPPDDPSSYMAVIQWGDGSSSQGTISSLGGGFYQVKGSHTYAEDGTYAITVTITEPGNPGQLVTHSVAVVAEGPEGGPGDFDLVTPPPQQCWAAPGMTFSAPVTSFVDPGPPENANSFVATISWGDGSPASTGTVVYLGGSAYDVFGNHVYNVPNMYSVNVTLSATDETGTTTASSMICVSTTGLLPNATAISTTEGGTFSGPLVHFTDTDGNTNPNAYAPPQINWGDNTSSTGAIVPDGAGGFFVVGNHSYTTDATFPFNVLIRDIDGDTMTSGAPAYVDDAALSATGGLMLSATEGSPFSGTVASFSDANPNAQASDFTAQIDWGDGQVSSGTVASDGHGHFTVSGSNTYAADGTYTVTVSIGEANSTTGFAASTTSTMTVGPATPVIDLGPGPINLGEGDSIFLTGTVSAGQGDPLTGSVDYGDGSGSQQLTFNGPTFSLAHQYNQEGNFTLQVTVTDPEGATGFATLMVQVTDVPPTVVLKPVRPLTEGGTFSTTGSFTDVASDGPWQATVNYGDGTGSQPVALNGNNFALSHRFPGEGTFAVTVTVTNRDGVSGSATLNVSVLDAPLTVAGWSFTATEGAVVSNLAVTTFTDAGVAEPAGNYVATIDWGDGTTSSGTVVAGTGGTFTVRGSHTYAEQGSYRGEVTVRHGTADPATGSGTATVADAPLRVSAVPVHAVQGTAFTGTVATVLDTGGAEAADGYQVLINWGDNTSSPGVLTRSGFGFVVTGTHTYATAGSFTVSVTVIDRGGAQGSASASATVSGQPGPTAAPALRASSPAGSWGQALRQPFTALWDWLAAVAIELGRKR